MERNASAIVGYFATWWKFCAEVCQPEIFWYSEAIGLSFFVLFGSPTAILIAIGLSASTLNGRTWVARTSPEHCQNLFPIINTNKITALIYFPLLQNIQIDVAMKHYWLARLYLCSSTPDQPSCTQAGLHFFLSCLEISLEIHLAKSTRMQFIITTSCRTSNHSAKICS